MDGEGEGMDTSPSQEHSYPYLASLNEAQLTAVMAPSSLPLQILAGPGSGKTKVLTSRVAYLVQHHGYRPHEIVAVTFTNKSAKEMRKRLQVLLGQAQADQLILGTFHSTCVKYLRRYGKIINLPNNFVIADAEDCKKLVGNILKERKKELAEANMSFKEGTIMSEISKAKAKGETPEGMALRAERDPNASTSTAAFIADIYGEYEAALRESNSLDFDDLLVFALKLFTEAPYVVADIRHTLVDEFQDTNNTQYELLKCFAKAHMGVSVVGDPDQSIYGWRSAEIENLNKMTYDFPGVQAINLEQNYRSTGSILNAAYAVVSQDHHRIQKHLYTSHPQSIPVTLKVFESPVIEASFIATEIKRLIAYSGGLIKYDDIAILLRYNALSRVIESALQKDSIPNRIVGGHKFFERMEIKDLLAYLQLADNPEFNPAFMRVINVPKRSLGEKTLADIIKTAKSYKISPMELCERVTDGESIMSGLKSSARRTLATFVDIIRKLKRAAQKGTPVSDLIKFIIEKTGYEGYLRISQQDFDSRWENIQELITYSVTVAEEHARLSAGVTFEDSNFQPANCAATAAILNLDQEEHQETGKRKLHSFFKRQSSATSRSVTPIERKSCSGSAVKSERGREEVKVIENKNGVIELLSSDEEPEPKEDLDNVEKSQLNTSKLLSDSQAEITPLAYFLQTSMLSTDTDSEKDENSYTPKVTIMTVHAAKGLEWPVVFIPAVEQGTYPSFRCIEQHEIAEERRLLYVAMTRAQNFLTLSYCQHRMMGGEEARKELSEFIGGVIRKQPGLFVTDMSNVDVEARQQISAMLSRPVPDEDATKEMIMRHVRAAPPLSTWDPPKQTRWLQSNGLARRNVTKATRAAENWASEVVRYTLPDLHVSESSSSGFTTARSVGMTRLPPPPLMPTQIKPPPLPVKSANKNIPAPVPFTFNTQEEKRRKASLGSFMNEGSSNLAMMSGLGLPDDASTNKPPEGFQKTGQLAKGTKRLGMGRPAPWGSKKPRAS
ncbi:uncharacterized protein L203_105967 [Cryptococcus depauperatus CBS 7841]|uniref:DNA 3'-5' helicase n=1 Tax=Cryptococcus depauperatus CBS 7841 TaxID=1295531 RepID=A0AAJ8JYF2_9TREE